VKPPRSESNHNGSSNKPTYNDSANTSKHLLADSERFPTKPTTWTAMTMTSQMETKMTQREDGDKRRIF
jgi:hypothetical protein